MSQSHNSWQSTLIVALLIAILAVLGFQSFTSYKSPIKWEYTVKTISDEAFEQEMGALGVKGWEAVSARRASDGNQQNPVFKYEVIFKRPFGVYEASSLFVK